MKLTPAQEFRRKKLAQLAAQQEEDSPYGAAVQNEYALMKARMVEHKRSLKGIQSKEGKGRYKVHALKDYDAWIEGVLQEGTGQDDDIFVTCLIWSMDAGLYARALEMAKYAIEHKLEAPDQFNRTLPVVIMDEFSNAAKAKKLGDEAAELLQHVIELTSEEDAPDELRAKLFKMHAFALLGRLDSNEINEGLLTPDIMQVALDELNRAFELDLNAGVIKEQRKLESLLKKAEQEQSSKKEQKKEQKIEAPAPLDDALKNPPASDNETQTEPVERVKTTAASAEEMSTPTPEVQPAPTAAHVEETTDSKKASLKKANAKTGSS